MILIGTSGFSYDDWRGRFYPPGLPFARMFDYYAERFDAIEVNATFYHIYSPRMMQSLIRRAEGRVAFAVKMTERVTHEFDLSREVIQSYSRGIEPASEAGVLSAVLFQFPFRFHCTRENREYLLCALKAFRAFPLVVEIRHNTWQGAEGMEFFRDHGINLCLMDMPRVSRLPRHQIELTGPIAYFRFHGRNSAQWFRAEYPGASYDYLYSERELRPWVEPLKRISKKAETTLAFFNNHVNGQAPENAYHLAEMLGQNSRHTAYRDLFTSSSWR